MSQLKSIAGYHLPQVHIDEVESAKQEFMDACKVSGLEKSRVAKKEINRNMFSGMRKNYFAL